MSSALLPTPTPLSRRLGALATTALGTVAFFLIVGIVSRLLRVLMDGGAEGGLRTRATLTISGSAIGEIVVFAILLLFLRLRSRSLRDLGFRQPSPARGWIVAGAITAIYLAMTWAALRGHAAWNEISFFRIGNSLVAGLSAGFVEEVFFRGWIMSELQWSGFGLVVQVIASGVLFGVAHAGWGLLTGNVNWAVALGSVVATSFLGALYAVTYAASRRSLMPVIAGHVIADVLLEPWLVLAALNSALAA